MPKNPYTDFAAVQNREMFFGREELLLTLFDACDKGQCFALKGTRHSGKSSLLKFLQSPELQEEFGVTTMLSKRILVFVSMRDYVGSPSEEDFFRDIYRNTVRLAAPRYNCAQQEEPGKKWSELFRECLQDLQNAGYRVVLLLDAFDKVVDGPQFGPQFFSILRADAEKLLISYITTSIHPLHTILVNGEISPLFNIFASDTIGPLEMEEARQLITEPAARVGLPFSSEEVIWIIEKAGRHPFFLQVTCNVLFEEKRKLTNDQVINFEQLAHKTYDKLAHHFESIWKDLSPEQQNNIKYAIQRANRPGQGRTIAERMEELTESELFRHYIRTTFYADEPEISDDELKTILEHYQDREFLAKSILATMHYVEVRRSGTNVQSHQLGVIIQEFLFTAFERMKPTGIRDDVSDVWRHYNILHFRYINQQLATEYIPPKLGIGRRQYFRSLDMAIKTLRRHLLELNNESFE